MQQAQKIKRIKKRRIKRRIKKSIFSTKARRAQLRRFLCAIQTKLKKGTRAAANRKEAIKEEYRRWKIIKLVDIEQQLKALVGEKAEFWGVQRPVLKAIIHYKSPVVAIIGTGGGKSVLFILPASCSTGVTVVVVLLVSLQEDIKSRCNKAGISCAQVVLVTPESAVGEAFSNFINRQRLMGQLDRIVINKYHVILDLVGGWRSRILALRNLVIIETQLEEDAVVELVESLKQKHAGGQVIIYCDTVKKTIRLAEVLECVCFHRNVGSSKEKSELVKQLTKGQQQVFTATNALGLDKRGVVHEQDFGEDVEEEI
ncbi:uncharacterized protein BDZ99DRAFT_487892 [Mytilinidion resinicola]|uniref:P-loop containing nucleoside triphosphate hydrolase protein n=1 Tax=Mytilinidion resinicola TaxID=574789 RepID=A0A6A6YLU6_9PEZI|nr:uncharacterized protein BDZ99DRAFT_487892 [Mytilinidion resinicola]KAF2809846.1 hypothetical protein BDZ99DRAFT_487892 [Mytilinidion resinicola]